MIICRSNAAIVAYGLSLIASPAVANILPEMSREQRWNWAELVAIAKPMTNCSSSGKAAVEHCSMRVVETIKGKPVDLLDLQLENVVAEWSVSNCCVKGHYYLLYLTKADGVWQSVDGHFGVRDLAMTPHNIPSP